MLDVGCGSGLHIHFWGYNGSLHYLKRRGFEVIGLEPSLKAKSVAEKYGLKVVFSLQDVKGGGFDFVRMNWSMEHVDSPTKYFREFKKILRSKGKLLISVPNYSGILYRIFPACVEIPVHTYYFTPYTLENYLHKFEFKIIDKFTFSYPGMFAKASEFLNCKPRLNMTPLGSVYFQSILNNFDSQMLGNDMVYFCENK
jgi:SAM-dependent methyltransferase